MTNKAIAPAFPAKGHLAEKRVTVKRVAEVAGKTLFTTGRSLNGYQEPSEEIITACEELTGVDRAILFPPDAPVLCRLLAKLVEESKAVRG